MRRVFRLSVLNNKANAVKTLSEQGLSVWKILKCWAKYHTVFDKQPEIVIRPVDDIIVFFQTVYENYPVGF